MKTKINLAFLFSLTLLLGACGTVQKAQYSALEKVGIHKRDILVDRIDKSTQTQEELKDKFSSAYDELANLVEVKDQGLESQYKKMAKKVEASAEISEELDDRIESVDEVANALFSEWQAELEQYQSASLKRSSAANLNSTKQRYATIYAKMQAAQQRVKPVLQVLEDNTLFLKHNLNARAISSISGEVLIVEQKVAVLIQNMEASIAESKSFIESMQGQN